MLKYKFEFIAVLVGFTFVAVFHGKILVAPNDYLIIGTDDGLRNYFMFASHIKSSEDCFEVSAMNYPYGEFLLLDDIHPALVLFTKSIAPLFPFVETHSVAIINLLLLFSIIVSTHFLFLIYKHFKVKPALAILGSIAVSALCSQVLLWKHGHWALGYICAFPMGWYLMIRLLGDPAKSKWSIIIALHTLFWFYIHPYMGLMLLLFNIVCLITNLITGFRKLKFMQSFVVMIVLPLVFYVLSIQLFDSHTQRPESFFIGYYVATLQSLLVSTISPFYPLIEALNLPESGSSWDNIGNYIGLSSILVLVIFSVYKVVSLIRGKLKVHQGLKSEWVIYWSAAVFTFLFAMGLPFKLWPNLELGPFSVVQQFTGYGRFAWIFYFIATSFSVYVLSKYFCRTKLQTVISFLLLGMLLTEGISLHRKIAKNSTAVKNVFNKQHLTPHQAELIQHIAFDQYQALISLPFYYEFSSPYRFQGSDQSIFNSLVLAYHSGLPLVNAFLPRPSISESRKIMQLFSPPHYQKEIESDLESKQPFLILSTHEDLNPRESELLQRAEFLFKNEIGKLYRIDYDQLLGIQNEEVIDEFRGIKDSTVAVNGIYSAHPEDIVHLDFDENESELALCGKGAYSEPNTGTYKVVEFTPDSIRASQDYVISLWFYNKNIRQTYSNINLEINDANTGILTYEIYHTPFQSGVIFGQWTLVEIPFTLKPSHRATLIVNAANPIKDQLYIDELLIRPVTADVFREIEVDGRQIVLKNNHIYVPNSN